MKSLSLVLSIVLLALTASAQTSSAPPVPPVTGSVDQAASAQQPRYEDNVRPLAGVQDFDLGNRTDLSNLLTPTLDFSGSYGTNPGLRTGPVGETVWGSLTNMGGSLELARSTVSQHFLLGYRGAAQINSYNSELNTQIHSLNLSETINAGRWNYVLGNTFSYEPNSLGATAPLLFPGMDTGFRPGVGPEANVLTEQHTRLNNTSLGQVSYNLSRASMLTGSVSYGILHYTDDEFFDTKQLTSSGSYNRRFGRNTIGTSYTYSRFMYSAADENFDTHAIELTYGRRIIGRISIELGAGPTITRIHVGPTANVDVSANCRASLRYAGIRTGVHLGYSRAVTAGSGVTTGALTDSVSGVIDRKLTQHVTANISLAFSNNTGTSALSPNYKNLTATAGITREIGRNLSVTLGYNGQRQVTNADFGELSSHMALIALHWKIRPVRLQ